MHIHDAENMKKSVNMHQYNVQTVVFVHVCFARYTVPCMLQVLVLDVYNNIMTQELLDHLRMCKYIRCPHQKYRFVHNSVTFLG